MVRFDTGTADVQAHAQALGFGAEERFEQTFWFSQAMAAINHGDLQMLLVRDDSHFKLVRVAFFQGLQARLQQIEQYLLDQNRIGQHVRRG